jgi:hypothetical protein
MTSAPSPRSWPTLPHNPKLHALTAGYFYARTVASAATGRIAEADAALSTLKKLADTAGPDDAAGLNTDAKEVQDRFAKAWQHADIAITASAF